MIPADQDEDFSAVELGTGAGWLSAAVLHRFPQSQVLGLDPSPAMRAATTETLAEFSSRVELCPFRLEDTDWLEILPAKVRCFVSSLVIHHVSGEEKRVLYRRLFEKLEPGGALLIADIVAPRNERERGHMARAWDEEVRKRSLDILGNLEAHERFRDDQLNYFLYPDEMDKPSTIPEHLQWLQEAGFAGSNVFWAKAGHALYGGYKASK